MWAGEVSTTPDSSRLQTFRHQRLNDCLSSEYSCCKSRHTCCSQASSIWMVYSYKAWTARICLKYLSCMGQSPIICTHAWPSCHFDLSTYNNLTLPHLELLLGHLSMPFEVHIVRTDISAVSLTATAFSALEVCEPQYAVGFSTSPKTHHTPWTLCPQPLANHLQRVSEFVGLCTCSKISRQAVRVASQLVGVSSYYPSLICCG